MTDSVTRPDTLSPRIRRVLANNPSAYTYTGTQTYIVGQGDVAVIDPGPADPAHVAALVAATAGERVVAIVCTHTHRDHSPAAALLAAATGAPIIGCAPIGGESEDAETDAGPRVDAAYDTDYAPDHVLADGERIAGKNWTLVALATPGHTSNHLCFALPEEAALFTGDHVMGWATTVVSPPDGDMAAYMASLAVLQARDDAIYYPAHGDPVTNPRQFVRGLAGHRRQRERQIVTLLGEGASTIATIVPRMYAGIDPRLAGAAGRSVLAHLIDLAARGQVVACGEEWALA